jgi:hypothetical protein
MVGDDGDSFPERALRPGWGKGRLPLLAETTRVYFCEQEEAETTEIRGFVFPGNLLFFDFKSEPHTAQISLSSFYSHWALCRKA